LLRCASHTLLKEERKKPEKKEKRKPLDRAAMAKKQKETE
jgi:hypothetical protein